MNQPKKCYRRTFGEWGIPFASWLAAVTALASWILIAPPPTDTGSSTVVQAPLSSWWNYGMFDSLNNCATTISQLRTGAAQGNMAPNLMSGPLATITQSQLASAYCLSSDDSRLQGVTLQNAPMIPQDQLSAMPGQPGQQYPPNGMQPPPAGQPGYGQPPGPGYGYSGYNRVPVPYGASAPAYGAGAPAPAYGGYTPPGGGYGASGMPSGAVPGYGSAPGYGAAGPSGYAPPPGYAPAPAGYGPPPGYGAPSTYGGVPGSGYSPPSYGYGAGAPSSNAGGSSSGAPSGYGYGAGPGYSGAPAAGGAAAGAP